MDGTRCVGLLSTGVASCGRVRLSETLSVCKYPSASEPGLSTSSSAHGFWFSAGDDVTGDRFASSSVIRSKAGDVFRGGRRPLPATEIRQSVANFALAAHELDAWVTGMAQGSSVKLNLPDGYQIHLMNCGRLRRDEADVACGAPCKQRERRWDEAASIKRASMVEQV